MKTEHEATAKKLKDIIEDRSPTSTTDNCDQSNDPNSNNNVQIRISPRNRKSNIVF